MNTNHEQEVEKKLKQINDQPIPSTIDDHIHQGLAKGRRHRKRWDAAKHSGLSLVALFLLFALSVNFIPGFSNIAANIPGFERIVKLVEHDQGLQDALNNDYVQVIGESDTKQGITFTVDDIIVDKRRLIVFYSIETDEDYTDIGIRSAKLYRNNGEELDNYSLSHDRISLEEGQKSSRLDFVWNEDQTFDDQLSLYVFLEEYGENNPEQGELLSKAYTVTFPIDQEKIQLSKTYDISQTEMIADQKIHFEKLESFPTRQVLYLEYDEENTMNILQLSDLHLENENGETVAEVSRVSRSPIDDNKRIVSLTSNYFKNYEELYVVFSKAMAIEKQHNKVVVDLKNEELLAAPDEQLKLRDVSKANMFEMEDTLAITFELDSVGENEIFNSFSLSGTITDQAGNTYHSSRQSMSGSEYTIYLQDQEYNNGPLIFDIFQYPSYINKNIRIQVK